MATPRSWASWGPPGTATRRRRHAIHVAIDGRYAGHVLISDEARETRRVAGELGLDEYHSELLPADKVEHVERLMRERAEGRSLAFVGDGINDAPVLARADVEIAMGSGAAIEAADVVLMDDMPSRAAASARIARRTLGMARQNIAIAVRVAVLLLAGSASPRCGSPLSATWASWCPACSTPPARSGEVRGIPVLLCCALAPTAGPSRPLSRALTPTPRCPRGRGRSAWRARSRPSRGSRPPWPSRRRTVALRAGRAASRATRCGRARGT